MGDWSINVGVTGINGVAPEVGHSYLEMRNKDCHTQ
jgi:hypothetical protein